MLASWKQRVRQLKREAYALAIAARDPRVPWAAKAVIGLVLAHTFSPIDLIPDFIPVIGWIDDVFVLVVGLSLVLRLTPLPLLDGHIARLERAELDRDAIEAGPAPGATRSRPPPRLLR